MRECIVYTINSIAFILAHVSITYFSLQALLSSQMAQRIERHKLTLHNIISAVDTLFSQQIIDSTTIISIVFLLSCPNRCHSIDLTQFVLFSEWFFTKSMKFTFFIFQKNLSSPIRQSIIFHFVELLLLCDVKHK